MDIQTVSSLTEQLRKSLESGFPFVWVKGEVTNLSRPASGHIYFSLKDARSQLQCVWFLGSQKKKAAGARFDPLTGEVFDTPRPEPVSMLRNGMEILCAGAISVYASRGQYQLLVRLVQQAGVGLLAMAFEERKAKYGAMGYFAAERKRPLPLNPRRIALITSPEGAAIHDFLKLAGQRGLPAIIRIFPVPVQGEGAADKIAAAIELANAQNWAQVIVLVRGGGSLEDLWAFNEEVLAEAVFNSRLPVLAGIGHEVDATLADMTADLRAATPSHAAQLLWPLRRELRQKLDELSIAMDHAITLRLDRFEKELLIAGHSLALVSPLRRLERMVARNRELALRLRQEMRRWLRGLWQKYQICASASANGSALRQLANRGSERLQWLRDARQAAMDRWLEKRLNLASMNDAALNDAAAGYLDKLSRHIESLDNALEASSPLRPLQKGYALIFDKNGIVRSVNDCRKGGRAKARLVDGILELAIEDALPAGDFSRLEKSKG